MDRGVPTRRARSFFRCFSITAQRSPTARRRYGGGGKADRGLSTQPRGSRRRSEAARHRATWLRGTEENQRNRSRAWVGSGHQSRSLQMPRGGPSLIIAVSQTNKPGCPSHPSNQIVGQSVFEHRKTIADATGDDGTSVHDGDRPLEGASTGAAARLVPGAQVTP